MLVFLLLTKYGLLKAFVPVQIATGLTALAMTGE